MSDDNPQRRGTPPGATQTFDQLAVQHDPLLGRVVGNYHLLALAGEGASGRVYRARDVRLDRTVAVKFLHPTASHTHFEQEARALAKLGMHAGVVDIYTWGEHEGRCYLALEYLPESVASLIERRPGGLDFDLVAHIGLQCAEALAAAHRAGVTHGDIKPSNILLAEDGRTAKLCDFGLASLSANAPLQGGSPAYLAPECAAGAPASTASDVYSLGATLYAMLCGQPPVANQDPEETLKATAVGQIRPLRALRTGIPENLLDIITRALSTDPGRRYQEAMSFAEALKKTGEATVPNAETPRAAFPRLLRGAALAGAVLLAGFVVILGQSFLPGSGGNPVLLADARLQLNQGNYDAARAGFEDYLAKQPDNPEARYGLAYAFLLEGDHESAAQEFARLAETGMQAEGKAAVAYMASGEAARPALERAATDAPGGYASVLLAMLDMIAGNFAAARGRLEQVEESALKFEWQRRQYLQTLGQVYFKEGEFDEAEKIFAKLEREGGPAGGTAATGMASDYVALSRERAAATQRAETGAQIARLRELMDTLPAPENVDLWTSRPLHIWIPPVESGHGVILQESGLADVMPWRLSRALLAETAMPITPVERSVQGAILAEQEFSAALGNQDSALRLGRVLGAKLLLNSKVTRLFDQELLHVSLIDTETTRPVPVGEYAVTREIDPVAWLGQIQRDIVAAASRAYPVRGTLKAKDATLQLNIGKEVGVAPAMRFKVLPKAGATALAGVWVIATDKVEANRTEVIVEGAPTSAVPAEGWLVEAIRSEEGLDDAA